MARTSLLAAATLALTLAVGGCGAPAPVGDSGASGAFRFRKLHATLPRATRAPAVVAAAEAVFRDRGYAVESRRASEESGRIVAVPPKAGLFEKTEVTVLAGADATTVKIVPQPWGDKAAAASILDAIVARLGSQDREP